MLLQLVLQLELQSVELQMLGESGRLRSMWRCLMRNLVDVLRIGPFRGRTVCICVRVRVRCSHYLLLRVAVQEHA